MEKGRGGRCQWKAEGKGEVEGEGEMSEGKGEVEEGRGRTTELHA